MVTVLQAVRALNAGVIALCAVSVAQGRQPVFFAIACAINALCVVGLTLTIRTARRNQW